MRYLTTDRRNLGAASLVLLAACGAQPSAHVGSAVVRADRVVILSGESPSLRSDVSVMLTIISTDTTVNALLDQHEGDNRAPYSALSGVLLVDGVSMAFSRGRLDLVRVRTREVCFDYPPREDVTSWDGSAHSRVPPYALLCVRWTRDGEFSFSGTIDGVPGVSATVLPGIVATCDVVSRVGPEEVSVQCGAGA